MFVYTCTWVDQFTVYGFIPVCTPSLKTLTEEFIWSMPSALLSALWALRLTSCSVQTQTNFFGLRVLRMHVLITYSASRVLFSVQVLMISIPHSLAFCVAFQLSDWRIGSPKTALTACSYQSINSELSAGRHGAGSTLPSDALFCSPHTMIGRLLLQSMVIDR